MDRRALLRFGGFGALALLAGCGTMRPTGESGGSSAAASGIVSGIRSGAGLTALSPDAQRPGLHVAFVGGCPAFS